MTRKAHFLSRLGNQGISTTIWRGVSLGFSVLNHFLCEERARGPYSVMRGE